MSSTLRCETRANVVGELLQDLSALLVSCHAVPEAEQQDRWASDAERITAQVALALATARARLSALPGAGTGAG